MLLWNVFDALSLSCGYLHFFGKNRHFGLFNLLHLLGRPLIPLLFRLASCGGGTKLAAVSAILLADNCGLSFFILISEFRELLLFDRVFRLLELELFFAFELDVGFLFRGDARFKAIHFHASSGSAGLSGGSFFGGNGPVRLGFAVKAAPAENILLLFFVFFAFGRFNLLGILDDGGFLIKFNLGLFVRGLRKVLLLRQGWLLGFQFFVLSAVTFFSAGGSGGLTSGLRLLVLLLFASLLLKQVLNNLFLVTHCDDNQESGTESRVELSLVLLCFV